MIQLPVLEEVWLKEYSGRFYFEGGEKKTNPFLWIVTCLTLVCLSLAFTWQIWLRHLAAWFITLFFRACFARLFLFSSLIHAEHLIWRIMILIVFLNLCFFYFRMLLVVDSSLFYLDEPQKNQFGDEMYQEMPDVLIIASMSIFLLIFLLYMSQLLSSDLALTPNFNQLSPRCLTVTCFLPGC